MAYQEENEKQGTLDRGSKLKISSRQSVLLTNPENRSILVAKTRDDLNVLRQAGFRVRTDSVSVSTDAGPVSVVRVYIVAPEGDKIEFVDGHYVYNGEMVI